MTNESTLEKTLSAQRRNESLNDHTPSTNFEPDPDIPFLEYDETFGDKGRMTLDPPGPMSIVGRIIPKVGDDGKFWVIGYNWPSKPDARSNCAVARITAKGQMDESFGPAKNGFSQVNFIGGYHHYPEFIHELPDETLIIAGQSKDPYDPFSISKKVITKLFPNGIPDSNFGTGGLVDVGTLLKDALSSARVTFIPENVFNAIWAVDSGGRIFFLAFIGDTTGGGHTFLGRLTTKGALDESFQTKGLLRIQRDKQGTAPLALLMHNGTPSRMIIAIQDSADFSILNLTCHDENGDLVKTFGTNGFLDLSKDFDDYLNCSLTPGHDRIVVCGEKKMEDGITYAVLGNYTIEGAAAQEFNDGDPVYAKFAQEHLKRYWANGQQLATAPNTITVVGPYVANEGNHEVLARYTKEGTLDVNFFGQLPVDRLVSYSGQGFITDSSGRLIGAGRWTDPANGVDKATIFAFKDQSKKPTS